jgi:hypothetical protein
MEFLVAAIAKDDEFVTRLLALYSFYRTVLMNEKYYGYQLQFYKRWNRYSEIAVAVATSASIGAWKFWQTDVGREAWLVIASVATVVAVLKPILQLSKEIERYSKLHIGYCGLYFDLSALVDEVKVAGAFTREMMKEQKQAYERHKNLSLQLDGKESDRLVRKCMAEVNRQIPKETLWMPPPSAGAKGP